uniref:Uncharacterized protein n=1 Tax=Ciona intestinalis TaxID=7719 RepID=H2Y3J1_CIOIN
MKNKRVYIICILDNSATTEKKIVKKRQNHN